MPELPEVEIIKRQLSEYLVGHTVEKVEVRGPQVVRGDIKKLEGGVVLGVRRRGKGFIVEMDNGYSLAVHLKMTGQIIFKAAKQQSSRVSKKVGELPGAHTHVIFHLDEGAKLYYNDIRKFGWLHALSTSEVKIHPFFASLGREPFIDLDEQNFFQILQSSRMPVKNLLMDQRKIAGIGNIYANDALWKAGIDPRRCANTLGKEEAKRLFEAIISVLEKGILEGAASDNTYVDALGQEGNYQSHFLVYRRIGEKCLRCGGVIEKFVLGGRGTFWCPGCQK